MTKPAGTSDDPDLNDVQTLSKASITSASLPKISGNPKISSNWPSRPGSPKWPC